MSRKAVVLMVCLLGCTAFAQEGPHRLSLLLKGGVSTYRGLYIGNLGGNTSVSRWGRGPILGAGLEYGLSGAIRLQGTLEYASHPFDPEIIGSPIVGSPHKTFLDLAANVRFAMGNVYFLVGPALSWERTDEIVQSASVAGGTPWTTPGAEKLGVALNLGAGFMAEFTPQFALFVEGSLRGRQYASTVLQAGVMIGL